MSGMVHPGDECDYEEGDDSPVVGDFGFLSPTPSDLDGIIPFIPRWWPVDRRRLAQLVVHQSNVGSVIKAATYDEEIGQPIFGVFTCLPLALYRDSAPIQQLVEWLAGLQSPELQQLVLHVGNVGLLIDEFATPGPPEIAPHVIRGLCKEITWACEDERRLVEGGEFAGDAVWNALSYFIVCKRAIVIEGGFEFPLVEDMCFFSNAVVKVEVPAQAVDGDFVGVEYKGFVLVLDAEGLMTVRRELHEGAGLDEAEFADEDVPG